MADPTHRLVVGADFRVEPLGDPGGGDLERLTLTEVIPPDYDRADLHAMIARKVEDCAFALDRREFGRRPTRDALFATAARITALEDLYSRFPGDGRFAEWRARIRHILEASNAEIFAEWGSDPEA